MGDGRHSYLYFPDKESKTEKVSDFSSHIQEVKGLSIIKNLENIKGHTITFFAILTLFWPACTD